MNAISKSFQSPDRKRLIELMQQVNFGRIEDLTVRNGDPVFDRAPRVVHEVKFGGDNDPRPELNAGDFSLKKQVVELFEYFDQMQNADIEVLAVKHGLPFGMHIQVNL